jgi:hypothetical protein
MAHHETGEGEMQAVEFDRDEASAVLDVALRKRDEAHRNAFAGYVPQNFDSLIARMHRWDTIARKISATYGLPFRSAPPAED